MACLCGVIKTTVQPDKVSFCFIIYFVYVLHKLTQIYLQRILVEVCSGREQTVVPSAGDVITGRITHVNPRWAKCSILCVKDIVLSEPFHGILRREDVRATEKDRIEMYKCYRPNDIILARVVSFFYIQAALTACLIIDVETFSLTVIP